MPLYSPPRGGALRRPSAFRLALAANDFLSRRRNEGVRPDRQIPPGRVLDAREVERLFPGVDRDGLRGGALWYDAVIPDVHRLLAEMLRWAWGCGARALNHVEAVDLRVEEGRVTGLRALDRQSGETLELRAPAVVNCAGPWSRGLAGRFDRDLTELLRPVLAFNLLLDREPPSRAALAVASSAPGAQTWFLLPWQGKVLAGTRYVPAVQDVDLGSGPDERDVEGFLAELNAAWPGLRARREQVERVLWGWLPAVAEGSAVPASRPVVHDHGAAGGPAGLISVSGVKLTTARAVVERALAKVFALRGEPLRPLSGNAARPGPDALLPLEGW
jgi:glycerol-3-phosphate dehydrogenase